MSAKTVYFVGEINADLILGGLESFPIVDREITCRSFELTIGSSTAICSCAYSSLGGHTFFMGLAGEDEYGDFMFEGLQDFGIETASIRRTCKVRTGVTVNLIHGSTRTQVTYPGTIAAFSREHIDFDALEKADHIHIGGPYLQYGFLPHVGEVLSFARERDITTSLDPQWDGTERWQYLEDWLPNLSYFFPNQDEAISFTGAATAEEACRKLQQWTACPIVKLGRRGCLGGGSSPCVEVPGFEVEVVDTTGAGDSFDAGFLFAVLEKGYEVHEALRFASAVAARSCTFVGGVNARSSYQDILEFMESR